MLGAAMDHTAVCVPNTSPPPQPLHENSLILCPILVKLIQLQLPTPLSKMTRDSAKPFECY